jgi:hypothetical protein
VLVPLPLPDDQGRSVILNRNGVIPPDVKIGDMIKMNLMMWDILLEENDRMIVCGFVNVGDLEKTSLAIMSQMSPALAKKMMTLFQVTFAEPTLAINYSWHCYNFNGTLTCIDSSAKICSIVM